MSISKLTNAVALIIPLVFANAASARYVESDPIGLKGGVNTYAYVGSRPLNYVDPSGLVKWKGTINYGEGSLGWKSLSFGSWNRVTLSVDSECGADGKKLHAIVVASTTSFGLGVSIGPPVLFAGTVELDDGQTTVSADNLAGPLSFSTTGGVGTANGTITAGIAKGSFSARGTTTSNINFSGQGTLEAFSHLKETCGCQ